MTDFSFFNELANNTFKVSKDQILQAEQRMGVSFPSDLKQLYLEVGYGFIKGQSAEDFFKKFINDNEYYINMNED